jgi:hypothetical protein
MALNRLFLLLITVFLFSSSCLRYSFTGVSIPEGVETIYIPFFPDQSNSGLSDLSDRLNRALIDRFVNQSSLRLSNNENEADAVLDGVIVSYSNRPFSVAGSEEATQNQVLVTVRATFRYKKDDSDLWNKSFNGNFTFDPIIDPIEGERDAADQALQQIANNMFNDAVSNW